MSLSLSLSLSLTLSLLPSWRGRSRRCQTLFPLRTHIHTHLAVRHPHTQSRAQARMLRAHQKALMTSEWLSSSSVSCFRRPMVEEDLSFSKRSRLQLLCKLFQYKAQRAPPGGPGGLRPSLECALAHRLEPKLHAADTGVRSPLLLLLKPKYTQTVVFREHGIAWQVHLRVGAAAVRLHAWAACFSALCATALRRYEDDRRSQVFAAGHLAARLLCSQMPGRSSFKRPTPYDSRCPHAFFHRGCSPGSRPAMKSDSHADALLRHWEALLRASRHGLQGAR